MTGNLFESLAPTVASTAEGWHTAHCDGGSRGNPGPSGYGAVIEDPNGRVVAQLSEFLGVQTNNYAEYSGLLAVLAWANEHGAKRLRVVSDSELMVKQMKGQYKVASPILRPLWEQAKRLAARLEKLEMRHTLRGGNRKPTASPTKPWTKAWGGVGLSDGPTRRGLHPGRVAQVSILRPGNPQNFILAWDIYNYSPLSPFIVFAD
jgi:probable phosphoglycerate mutase